MTNTELSAECAAPLSFTVTLQLVNIVEHLAAKETSI